MTQHPPHLDLIAEIKAFIAEPRNMAASAFGVAAVGDPRFLSDLEAGRECRRGTIARVREYMATGITHAQAKARGEAA
jgi:hypothetical protein